MELHERYFERREIREAIAFAEAGGIAIHRNFDHYSGRVSFRGMTMTAPFVHVLGLRPQLRRWAHANDIPPQAIQPEKRRRVAHIDVWGENAQRLIARSSAS